MKEIQLTNCNKVTLVDNADYETLCHYKWRDEHGYAVRSYRENGTVKRSFMHRMITNAPSGMEVDHINFNKLDNQRANLRVCTRQENAMHLRRQRNNTSGYMGVHWLKSRKKWLAKVIFHGRYYHVLQTDDVVAAARAYDAKARELFGVFANTNFPQATR